MERVDDIDFTSVTGHLVEMLLNPEEMRTLADAAAFHGLGLSEYIKQQALREAGLPQVRIETNTITSLPFEGSVTMMPPPTS